MQPHIVLKPGDNVCVTISNIAVPLPEPDTDVMHGILTVESEDVRCRWDGTAPVAADPNGGLLMVAGSVWEIFGRDYFTALRFIRNGGADGYVVIAYSTGG